MQQLSNNPEELTFFICTNERSDNQVSCSQTLSFEDFKEIKKETFMRFGPFVKLVATKCQGLCPKNAFYTTITTPKKANTSKQVLLSSKEELQTLIKEELHQVQR